MITPLDYVKITCLIDRADILQLDADIRLVKMQGNIAITRGNPRELAILSTEIQTLRNKISEYRSVPNPRLVEAVRKLQIHVLKYNASVNSFLSNNNIKVSPFVANISSLAGHNIIQGNIGVPCGN